MNDATLITPEVMQSFLQEIRCHQAVLFEVLARREPVLASYLATQLLTISGKLALSGASPEVVQGCYADLVELVAVTANVIWRVHDDLWKGIDLSRLVPSETNNDNVAAEGFEAVD